MMMHRFAKFKL